MGLLSLSSDDIINIFVSGDKWCPIAIIGVKCPESTWYFTYHCCGELMSQCCMAPSVSTSRVLRVHHREGRRGQSGLLRFVYS
ncbi:hypothetical protein Y032_0108g1 [Ancylostoma ceylanicum]|uniref:Uncharacterized protein n=1 Tax=Ancylostoma ceylanicum TaxID=53326 RepID=A0A016TE70_9BILA|nr:hypothetical protein Y032_0108g1 [Ancylostoma ceylanicum]